MQRHVELLPPLVGSQKVISEARGESRGGEDE